MAYSLRHQLRREAARFGRSRLVSGCQIGSLLHRPGTYRALLCISELVVLRLVEHVPGRPHCNPNSHIVDPMGCLELLTRFGPESDTFQ